MSEEVSTGLDLEGFTIPKYARVVGEGQLSIPQDVLANFPGIEHFRVSCEDGRIVLTPIQETSLDDIHKKMQALGITEQDVADAIEWARGRQR